MVVNFTNGFGNLKWKPIAGFRVKKRNELAKIIFISTNLFEGFGRPPEEILTE